MYGPSDRAKDASPCASALRRPRTGCPRIFGRGPTTFPSSAYRRAPSVVSPPARRGGTSANVNGPTKACVLSTPREGRRRPVDQMLSTAATSGGQKDRSSCLPASASRSRRPHVFPCLGKGAFRALQARPRGLPRANTSRERAPFSPAGNAAPGTDDPSAPAGSVGVAGREG